MTEIPLPPLPDHCWPVDPSCCQATWDAYDEDVQDRAAALAGSTMRLLTGYQVGGCPITVRPCKAGCGGYQTWATFPVAGQASAVIGSGPGWYPINVSGTWLNTSCGCRTDCSCTALCEIELPPPVSAVTQVKVDGAVITDTEYRVDGNRLVWTGSGACPWPLCQDLAAADTEDNTFSVTYTQGYPVDAIGAFAAGRLACEFAKACRGEKCDLPAGVTQISRQGVTMIRSAESFPGGLTGLRDVDAYTAQYNPYRLKSPSLSWSPDQRRTRVPGVQSSSSP